MSMTGRDRQGDSSLLGRLAAGVLVVAALHFGKGLLIPFAMAVLLSFLLAPVVHALERLRLGSAIASGLTVALAAAGILALGWAVYAQLDDFGNSLPSYQQNIRAKLDPLRGDNPVQRIERGLAEAVEGEAPASPPIAPDGAARKPSTAAPERAASVAPVRVTLVPGVPTPFEFLEGVIGPLVAPLGTFGVVFVLVLFLLIYRQDLRNRFIRMVSPDRIAVTTTALSDASHRTSRYLLMTLLVNATYGIPVGVTLHFLGVPNPLLWGLFATLLRFIPYLGPWIAAAFPIALSFAISPGWALTAWVVGMFVVLELVSNNVVEPLVYGKGTGLSPVAVVFAAIFWTWLWGVPGLFLSVPLTLCLVVMGLHIPRLSFMNVLLGDEPSLAPGQRFYQRLVALDAGQAMKITEEYLRDHDLVELYDDVLLPALRLAKRDAMEGHLGPEAVGYVRDTTREILEVLSDEEHVLRNVAASATPGTPGEPEPAAPAPPTKPVETPSAPHPRVGFLSAGDETDALTGPMLADVARRLGLDLEVFAGNATAAELQEWIRRSGARLICIGGFAPTAVARTRYLYKRILTAVPDTRVVLALWGGGADRPGSIERLQAARSDRVATTMAEAVDALEALTADLATRPAPLDADVEAEPGGPRSTS